MAWRGDERVAPLELILDVVFVLAISQTTELVLEQRPSWISLFGGLLTLCLLWRGWTGFAWLTSALDPASAVTRVAVFVALGAFTVLALSISQAFHGAGLVFAGAYAVIRALHVFLGRLASTGDEGFRSTVLHNAWGGGVAVALLVLGALLHGSAQYVCWALAVAADYAIPAASGQVGWRLVPGHFAERHALIIIIALGESILAIGLGVEGSGLAVGSVALALVGVCLVATQWWAYFDGVAEAGEHRLAALPPGPERNRVAREGYSLLHLPLFAGDILASLGVHAALHDPGHAFSPETSVAMFGGLAAYLLGLVGFRLRMTGTLNRERLAVGVLMLLLIPVGTLVPGWVAFSGATALMVVLIAVEQRSWVGRAASGRSAA